jgi:hypothetical protein
MSRPYFHEIFVIPDPDNDPREERRVLVQGRDPETAMRRCKAHFGPRASCKAGNASGYDHVLTAAPAPERLTLS